MKQQQSAIGINLGVENVQAADFNDMHTRPSLIANINGYMDITPDGVLTVLATDSQTGKEWSLNN